MVSRGDGEVTMVTPFGCGKAGLMGPEQCRRSPRGGYARRDPTWVSGTTGMSANPRRKHSVAATMAERPSWQ